MMLPADGAYLRWSIAASAGAAVPISLGNALDSSVDLSHSITKEMSDVSAINVVPQQ